MASALISTPRRKRWKVLIKWTFYLTLSKKVHIMRGMNKLPLEKRVQILSMLVEGSSMRSVSRVCGVSINTVTKLLVDAGTACAAFHDEKVRNVTAKAIQCDEIWCVQLCQEKERQVRQDRARGRGRRLDVDRD